MRRKDPPFPVAVAALLSIALLALPVGQAVDSQEVLLTDQGDGNTGWGILVDQETPGDIRADIVGTGPVTASELSMGVTFFEGAEPVFMIAFTWHLSPDRTVLEGEPAEALTEPSVVTDGDPSALSEDVDIEAVTHADSQACPLLCLVLTEEDAQPGEHRWVGWMGGLSSTELTVQSTGEATAHANKGPAHVVGDPELEGGAVNAQVQHSEGGQVFGAKAMLDVPYSTVVEGELFGFFSLSTVKVACIGSLPCLTPTTVAPFCTELVKSLGIEESCGSSAIGWDGPAGSGSAGDFFSFLGEPGGAYTFTVERKVDAYGPLVFDPGLDALVFAGEDHTFLTATDVSVP